MKCLDTDFLIAILRGESDAKEVVSRLDRESGNATTTINAFELFYGANRSQRRSENVQKVRTILGRVDVVPLSSQSAERACEILASLATSGELIDYRDALIAGIALESGLTLVTRNKKHFSRIARLKLEAW